MNNKLRMIIIAIATQMCYSSPSKIAAALNRIKLKHHLQKQDDYIAAAVNKKNGFNRNHYCTDLHDIVGVALGSKHVVWLESPGYFFQTLLKDKDCYYILQQKNMRCIKLKHKQGSMCLMYSPEGRHKAFALIKAALDLIDKGYKISQHTNNTTFEYLTGVCLGYSLDDIDFYFQRIAFHNIKGYWPKAHEEFDQFLKDEWIDSQERIDLEQAALEAKSWLNERSDITLLQRDIDSYQKNNKNIDIQYDIPYTSFIQRTSIKSRLVYALNYVIANTLTLGSLIPWI